MPEDNTYIPLDKTPEMDLSEEEITILSFFIQQAKQLGLNSKLFQVNLTDKSFINSQTGEKLEVIRDEKTNELNIKSKEGIITKNMPDNIQDNTQGIKPIERPPISMQAKENTKVRKLTNPNNNGLNNAAFAKISILVTLSMLTALFLSFLIMTAK